MKSERPVLFGYWRSTAAYRVRIALNLKNMEWDNRPVDLVADGGQQNHADYVALNPSRLVPTLQIDGLQLSQSMAICEYLDETRPEPPLLPAEPGSRAWVRALAQDVACDIHPLNNLRVQQFLKREYNLTEQQALTWMDHWMQKGFAAMEGRLQMAGLSGTCCMGNEPGLADIFLIAQAYNADRFGSDLTAFPILSAIIDHCRSLPAFAAAAPELQPDAP